MGLDMYLRGEKFLYTDWNNPDNNLKEDGFRVCRRQLELGYWRKHPNLHGFIVQTFANGLDECQRIELCADDLRTILAAVDSNSLPFTTGFFFGESDGSEREETMRILNAAIEWLETEEPRVAREVFYQASW